MIAKPFSVGRYYIPWRPGRTASRHRILVRFVIRIPVFPLFEVGQRQLPVPSRVLHPLLEPPFLLFLADVQKEFQDRDAVLGEHSLEIVDLTIAAPPDFFWNQVVHSHHQHIFVVGAIKDPTTKMCWWCECTTST